MMTRGRLLFLAVSVTVVGTLVAGTLLSAAAAREPGADSLYKHLSVFTEVFSLVRQAYVDETSPDTLMAGALDGAADALDPFSMFIPARQVEGYLAVRDRVRERSGVLLLKEHGMPYVVAVMPAGPSAAAGIEAGDLVAKIGGRSTRLLPLWELHQQLAAAPGTKVELELIRRGEPKQVTLELGSAAPPPPALSERDGVAVLRISAFDGTTAARVRELLASALGVQHRKLLVDLRDVAGGDPALGYEVARLFVAGDLGALLGRPAKDAATGTSTASAPAAVPAGVAAANPTEITVFRGDRKPVWQGEIVVLQDRSTLGPSEVLATVLRQSAKARLVGETSFGYAGRQALLELSTGDRFQLTDAFFSGPDRQRIDDGLEPDLEVDERSRSFQEQDLPLDEVIFDRGVKLLLGDAAETAKKAA